MRLRGGAVLLVLVLAGCGGSGTRTKTVTVEETPSTGTAATPEATASPSASTQAALATRDGQVDKQPVVLEIAELKRSGTTVSLTLRLRAKRRSPDRAQVAGSFDDGLYQKQTGNGATSVSGGNSLDGVYLIDSANRKKYLVGRDEDERCTCDSDLGSAFVDGESPLVLSATYGAPPPDVKALDVFVPRFGTFKDVPLS